MSRAAAPTTARLQFAPTRTTLLLGLLLAGLALMGAGCTGLPGPPTAGSPSPVASPTGLAVVSLTVDQPSARIAQARQPSATAVRLAVQAVQNPGGQGLALGVAVEDASAPAQPVDIGTVSLYPADHPDVFTLMLPDAAARMVHAGPTVLIVTLIPVQSGATLQPGVRLSLSAWLTRL